MTLRSATFLIAATLLLVPSASLARGKAWSTFKHDNARSGLTAAIGPQTNAIRWQHLLKGPGIQAPVAIGGDDVIYSGSSDGNFYAFYSDGSLRYKLRFGRRWQITAAPAIAADNTAYVPTERGILYAISPHAELAWSFDLEGYAGASAAPAVRDDGVIYVGAKKFNAVNPDGSLLWSYDTGSPIAGPAAIGRDGTVYFPSANYLYALDAGGTLLWRARGRAQYPLGSAPAVAKDGTIYINTNDGVLHAFTHHGKLAWKYPTEGIVMDVPASPAIGQDGTIYFGGGGEHEGQGGYLYALDPDGGLKWKFFAGCDQTAAAVGGDGTIYFASDSCGTIHALHPDGSLKWTLANASVYMRGAPAIARDGTLYAGMLAGPTTPDTGGLLAIGP